MLRNMFGYNMSVILNSYLTSIALKNKHNAIKYHLFIEVVSAGFINLERVVLENNYADILTKSLSGPNHYALFKALIFTTTI